MPKLTMLYGQCRMGFVANFIRFPECKNFEICYDLTKLQRVYRWTRFWDTV